jgi:hypothetical protein
VALVLRSLTVLSDTTVAVTFEDDAGAEVTFRFEAQEVGPDALTVINGESAFTDLYRRTGSPITPQWPEGLVHQVLAARQEPLPYGAELERLTEQVRQEKAEHWKRGHQPS